MDFQQNAQNQNPPNIITENKYSRLNEKLKSLMPVMLRLSMAGIFLWFGSTQLLNVQGWISYLPEFLLHTPVDPKYFIFLNGSMEVILGICLILGAYIRLSAFVLGGHLLGIALSIGFDSTGVRDIGLSLACLAVALQGSDIFSLDRYYENRKKTGNPASALLLNGALAFMALIILAGTYYVSLVRPLSVKSSFGQLAPISPRGVSLEPLEEVLSLHNKASDCWLKIEGKYYNVTEYINFHPGGKERIISNCGTDATAAFNTKGNTGGTHSTNAHNLLAGYEIKNAANNSTNAAINSASPANNPPANNQTQTNQTPPPAQNQNPLPANNAPSSALTASQVAGHNKASDCWLIISGKVYNVTQYINFHPGGQNRIISNCGKDATTAFNTKGGTGNAHSTNAHNILAGYLIGSIGSAPIAVKPTPTPGVTPTPIPTATVNPTPTPAPTPTPSGSGITIAQVSSHSSSSNCWLIIEGKIYNVTQYIPFHPGGQNQIIPNCGKDATTAFNTKGGSGNTHSANAHNILAGYFVGNLNSAVPTPTPTPVLTPTPISTPTPTATPTPTPTPTSSGTAYTAAQVATHNTSSNCWLIISGSIYNVTQYIPFHPGGQNQIIPNCGTDATTAFNTKGGSGNTHSTNAHNILAGYLVGTLSSSPTPTPTPGSTPTPTPTATPTPTPGNSTYTAAQVATHNTSSNCWLIISGSIYNVTQYIPFHPGGQNRIITNCGKESTVAFDTQGGGGSHSNNARNILAGYLIGTLSAGNPTPTPTPTPGSTPTPTPTPTGGATTYIVTVTNSGVISPAALNINVGDTVKFTYPSPGDEVILVFTPTPPNSIKLDHDITQKSYTFNTAGTYTYKKQGSNSTNASIIVH